MVILNKIEIILKDPRNKSKHSCTNFAIVSMSECVLIANIESQHVTTFFYGVATIYYILMFKLNVTRI